MIYLTFSGWYSSALTVLAVTALPSTAEDSTIAAVTATPIGGVTASTVQPGSPASGDVWINTDPTAAHSVTLGGEDSTIYVPIKAIKQYVGSAWVPLEAYARISGSWVHVSYSTPLVTDVVYSGTKEILDDGDGNWRMRLLTSGVLTVSAPMDIDIFLVGGGAGGGPNGGGAGGGGGGYTNTYTSIQVQESINYEIMIGAGGAVNGYGGATSAFEKTANGGNRPQQTAANSGGAGGNGGSGGGAPGGAGGSDGGNGYGSSASYGKGQGTTTREFAELSGDLYAGGGGAYNTYPGGAGGGGAGRTAGTNNSGGGGGFASAGGCGIVVIRNHREVSA